MKVSWLIALVLGLLSTGCLKDDLKDLTLEDNLFHPDKGDFIALDSATRDHIAFGNAVFKIYGRADFPSAIDFTNFEIVVKNGNSELYVSTCRDGSCITDGNGTLYLYNNEDNTFRFEVTLVDYVQTFTFSIFLRKNREIFTNRPSITVPY